MQGSACAENVEARLAGFLRRRDSTNGPPSSSTARRLPPRVIHSCTATLGVPDTLDGRFDAIVSACLSADPPAGTEPDPGPALAQAVFDAMFPDMDINLREMGVGDMSVGKRNRAMWEAFHGRSAAYAAAWHDPAALAGRDRPQHLARRGTAGGLAPRRWRAWPGRRRPSWPSRRWRRCCAGK